MKKTKISHYFIIILLFTLVTFFAVVVQKSYSNLIGPIQKAKESNLTKPIDSNLDIDTLKLVEDHLEPSI